MKRAYFLAAMLSLAACDEIESASDDFTARPLDSGTMDANRAPLDAEVGDAARDAGEPTDASPVDATSPADATVVPADAGSPVDGGRTDYEVAEALAARGRQCGVIGEGTWSPEYSQGSFCASGCLLQEADCAAFRSALCAEGTNPPSLDACLKGCKIDVLAGPIGQCGDGTTVPYRQLCDGTRQCASGEDEQNCVFKCSDGKLTFGLHRCDGVDDCEDKSDEQGCATLCGQPRW